MGISKNQQNNNVLFFFKKMTKYIKNVLFIISSIFLCSFTTLIIFSKVPDCIISFCGHGPEYIPKEIVLDNQILSKIINFFISFIVNISLILLRPFEITDLFKNIILISFLIEKFNKKNFNNSKKINFILIYIINFFYYIIYLSIHDLRFFKSFCDAFTSIISSLLFSINYFLLVYIFIITVITFIQLFIINLLRIYSK